MKRLLLLRHGKSDWNVDSGTDHERPLNPRGERAARRMGRFLAAVGAPDAVVTSTAERARATVELAAEAGGWTCPVRATRRLYEATPSSVLEEVRAEPDTTATLLLAGHEPTWSDLAGRLIGAGRVRMVTAAVAAIDLDVARWSDIEPGRGVLVFLIAPKLLDAGAGDGS